MTINVILSIDFFFDIILSTRYNVLLFHKLISWYNLKMFKRLFQIKYEINNGQEMT